MIVRAIECLKDKNGSSRTEISKFIAVCFFGLPSEHELLLSNHIRGLKKDGVIADIKRLYRMAGESSGAPKRRVAAGGSSKCLVVASKRGRPLNPGTSGGRQGRLLKTGDPVVARRSGRSRKVPNSSMVDPASIFADLKKQKPGRPRKGLGVSVTPPKNQKPGRQKPGRPAKVGKTKPKAAHQVYRDAGKRKPGRPINAGKRKPGQPANVDTKIVHPVSGDVEGLMDTKMSRRSTKVVQPGLFTMNGDGETCNTKQKLRTSPRLLLQGSVSKVVAVEPVTGKRKSGPAQKVVKLVGVEKFSGKRVYVDGKRGVVGSVGNKKPEQPIKMGRWKVRQPVKVSHMISGDVESPVGTKKSGLLTNVIHPPSGDVEGLVGRKKRGRPAKIVQPGLSLMNGADEIITAKKKPRTSQRLLLLGFGSKNVATEAVTGKRKRGEN